MDQYVSCGLSKDDKNLDFCQLQSNEVHAQFDLFTSFHQGNKSVNEWYNDVQVQVNLARYPTEILNILHRNIFWFFLCDEDFVLRTIMEGVLTWTSFPPVESDS